MLMTSSEQILTIGMVVLGTMMTRFLPFVLFPPSRPTPAYIQYLGKVLPSAALGLLVIYSVKDIQLFSGEHGVPELIAITVVIALHYWKKNMLLSIAGGTVLYMLFVQMLF